MTQKPASARQPVAPRPIETAAEAQQVVGHLSDVMDALLGVVEQETKLVRAGRLSQIGQLEPKKTNLAQLYVGDLERLKASHPYLSKTLPGVLQALRERHNSFHAVLQLNLAILASAHAVSESIMRGVSEEITRKSTPQTYGASGRQAPPNPRNAQPLTVSRVL
jgi:flagellar biosynthesis/type III secretory pathway chaperone